MMTGARRRRMTVSGNGRRMKMWNKIRRTKKSTGSVTGNEFK